MKTPSLEKKAINENGIEYIHTERLNFCKHFNQSRLYNQKLISSMNKVAKNKSIQFIHVICAIKIENQHVPLFNSHAN